MIKQYNFSEQISENFSVAKLLAILLVATGHYFDGSLLWVPVSIGLFVFSFSSGYFSAGRYRGRLDIRKFWSSKFRRLLPAIFIVNIILLLFFLWQGKSGIWHPHTLLAWFGLSGIIDWFGIRNASPFGNGLWFLTVLLLFYVAYPLVNGICTSRNSTFVFIACFAVICFVGQLHAPQPYMLWLTVFGFGFGVFASRVNWRPSRFFAFLSLIVIVALFLTANIYGFKQFNILFIAAMSMATVAILLCVPLRESYIGPLALWMPCVLEIYLLHTYVFVRLPELGNVIGYLLSMVLVLTCAYAVSRMRNLVEQKIG
jgi:peptidoglycan/LPS O-acetylase OafA/YrhL